MAIGTARSARIEITAGASKVDAGLSDARKKLRAFGRDTRKLLGNVGGKVKNGLGGALTGALAGAGLTEVGGLAGVASDVFEVEKALTRLQIAGDGTPQQMQRVRDSLYAVSNATGLSRREILESASSYVALTGDLEGASANMATFAAVANASGASLGDIASTAAALRDNLKIDPKDFRQAFSILLTQGKQGAIELRDLAGLMASVAPQAANFKGGAGLGGLADLGGALQVARKGFGSAEEAATGVNGLFAALIKNSDKFEKAGVKVFDKNPKTGQKTMRGFLEIVDAIGKSRLMKDPEALEKAFGRNEAYRTFNMLFQQRELLADIIAKSKQSDAVNRDAATFQQSAAGKMAIAWERIKNAFAEQLTPERIEGIANAFTKVADAIGTVANALDTIAGNDPLQQVLRDQKGAEAFDKDVADKTAFLENFFQTKGARLTMARSLMLGKGLGTGVDHAVAGNLLTDATADDSLRADASLVIAKSLLDQRTKTTPPSGASTTVFVKVGADTVAKAHQNAPSRRRRPGT